VELKKDDWEYVDMLWCQGDQKIGLSKRKLQSALNAPYDHNARPYKTDRQTDEHGNSATIRSNECIAR